jgi:hypothetical protein
MIDRDAFTAAVTGPLTVNAAGLGLPQRPEVVPGLTDGQAAGCLPLLDEWENAAWWPSKRGLTDLRWLATILANVLHATAGAMAPQEEADKGKGLPHAAPLDDGGRPVFQDEQLDRGMAGLPAIPTWVYCGRGYLERQTRGRSIYRTACDIGIDLLRAPERLLEPAVAARVAIFGMVEGHFTGFGLRRFFRPDGFEDWYDARRTVDAHTDADAIAARAKAFHAALLAASSDGAAR